MESERTVTSGPNCHLDFMALEYHGLTLSMMKTLHLTNAWAATSGGVATFYRALIDAANERQQFIRLVAPDERTWTEEVGRFGRIYHVKAPRAPFNRNYRVLYYNRGVLPGTSLHRILAEEKPDLVEICDKYALNWLAGLMGIGAVPALPIKPVLVALSCERMDDNLAAYVTRGAAGRWFSRFYMKWFYFPLFHHHITVSEYTADELRLASRGHRLERGIWVRPMGVDLGAFSPWRRSPAERGELLRKVGGGESTVLLLYTGRLAPEKNLDLLVGVMRELAADRQRDYRLLVAGDGIRAAKLRADFGRATPGRVTFLGHVGSKHELAGLYANTDCFLHPNPREPFGIAPLEAMASGLPLVAPNSGGLTAYANERNAWLAAAEPRAFADAVRAVFDDLPGRRLRVEEALRTAAQLDWPRVAHNYLRLYDDIHALASGRLALNAIAPRLRAAWGRKATGPHEEFPKSA